MKILIATNEAYAQHAAVCLLSLRKNNQDAELNVKLASLDLSSHSMNKLYSLAKAQSIILEIVDFKAAVLDDWPQIGVYSKEIYIRLWVDEFFANEDVEKVLYLDADTIVVDELSELWEIDLKDKMLAAVDIPGSTSHYRCHLPKEYSYFNSGVLLINIKKWRDESARDSVLTFLTENKEIALNPDQDALNGLFYKQRVSLDYTYNAISPFFRKATLLNYLTRGQLKDIIDNVKIVHFNGRSRPWHYDCNHPYQKKYLEYLSQTPWAKCAPEATSSWQAIKKKLRVLLGLESFVQLSRLNGQ